MTERIYKYLLFAIGMLLLSLSSEAKIITIRTDSLSSADYTSLFPEKTVNLSTSHFTWGVEFGSSIDVTAHNHSTFNLDVNIGYKNDYFKVIGIGCGIHRSIESGNNYIPVYALMRTSFRKKPSLLFMNLELGYSFNTIADAPTFGDFSNALGIGVNLSSTRKANCYIILSAGSRYFNENHKSLIKLNTKYIFVAKLQIGINF